jgi:hypothetical protein
MVGARHYLRSLRLVRQQLPPNQLTARRLSTRMTLLPVIFRRTLHKDDWDGRQQGWLQPCVD